MKNVRFRQLLVSQLFLLLVTTIPVFGETMKFKYKFKDGSVLEGRLDGTVDADQDRVWVNSFGRVTFNGVDYPSIDSSEFATPDGSPALVSFSGNAMWVYVCPLFLDPDFWSDHQHSCPVGFDAPTGGFAFDDATGFGTSFVSAVDAEGAADSRMSSDLPLDTDAWSLCRVPGKGHAPCRRGGSSSHRGPKQLFIDPVFQDRSDVLETRDVVYGTGEVNWNGGAGPIGNLDLLLDVYEPIGEAAPNQLPAMIFLHGGGGDKRNLYSLANVREFASRGYVALSINHRFYEDPPPNSLPGDRQYTAAIVDTIVAVDWLREHAAELSVDTDRITLVGSSQGAIISLFTALIGPPTAGSPDPLERLTEVAAVVELSGGLFGSEGYVDPTDPPVFIGQSVGDPVVSYTEALNLEGALIGDGVPFAFPPVSDDSHGTNTFYAPVDGTDRIVRDEAFDFLYAVLDLGSLAAD